MEKTTTCKYFRALADQYIEGELTAKQMRELEVHLTECEGCRREFYELRALKSAVRSSAQELPEVLHSRIMDAIKAEPKPKKKALIFRRSALSAACFFICLSLTIIIAMLPMWNPSNGGGMGLPEDPEFIAGGTQAASTEAASKTDGTDAPDDVTEEVQPEALETVPQSSVAAPAPELSPSDTLEETMSVAESTMSPADEITAAAESIAPPTETAVPETEAEAENAAGSVVAPATDKLHTKGENEDASTDGNIILTPSPKATYAPGGEEITMALLVVSGLLAVASFIAFLISLSSVRNTPHKKDKED